MVDEPRADSPACPSRAGLLDVVREARAESGYCAACVDGVYPIPLEDGTTKLRFEDIHGA